MQNSGAPADGSGRRPVTDEVIRRRRKVLRYVFIPPAILALSLVINGAKQASERSNATEVARTALNKAIKKVPFEVRLPTELPSAAPLVRTYLDEPDSRQGFQAYQLNTWYRTPGDINDGGGRTIHVWQSNDKFLARRLRDPLELKGTPETIGGSTWHQVIDDRVRGREVTTFSKRFDDGVTMTIDSTDPDLARFAIEKLAIVPVG